MTAFRRFRERGYLTTGDVARKLGVAGQAVDDWIKKGVKPDIRVKLAVEHAGRIRFVHPDELTKFLERTNRQPLLPFPPEDWELAA